MKFADATREFLNELDGIADDHGEIMDTECREQLFDALYLSVLKPRDGYELPEKYGLYEPEGNARVKAAFQRYVGAALPLAAQEGLDTPSARLDAFQNVSSDAGNSTDEYFGWLDPQDLA